MKKRSNLRILKIVLLLFLVFTIFLNFTYPIFYRDYVNEYSKIFDVDPYLVFATIKAESNFEKDATSSKGAKGLMQILDNTGEEIFDKLKVSENKRDLYNPEINIMVGTFYLSELLDRYNGQEEKAVAAYNSGMTNVDRWSSENKEFKSEIDFEETINYVEKIEHNHKMYRFFYDKMSLGFLAFPEFFINIKIGIRRFLRYIRSII